MRIEEYSDVIQDDTIIESVDSQEFEFDGFSLVKVNNHWEIQYEDQEGAEAIIIQPQDFESGKFQFEIDGQEKILEQEDFDKIEKFCVEQDLIKPI